MRSSHLFYPASLTLCLFLCGASALANDTKSTEAQGKAQASSNLMPSIQDLGDPAAAPVETKTQEIKDSRWVQPNQLKSTTKGKTVGSGNKVSLSASCTDASGKTFTSSDDAYAGCIQQVSASSQQDKARSGTLADKKSSDSKPSAGAGFQLKFGD